MLEHGSVDAPIEACIAHGGWALRPHDWVAVDGLPVEGWRSYVADRCEAAGVPYAFEIDLERRVTVVVNPRKLPEDAVLAGRISELLARTSGTA